MGYYLALVLKRDQIPGGVKKTLRAGRTLHCLEHPIPRPNHPSNLTPRSVQQTTEQQFPSEFVVAVSRLVSEARFLVSEAPVLVSAPPVLVSDSTLVVSDAPVLVFESRS